MMVIFGQPELDRKLAQRAAQIKRRITFQHHVGTLITRELDRYLSHCMPTAGHTACAAALLSRSAVLSVAMAAALGAWWWLL